MKDFHHISLKKQLNENKDKLPQLQSRREKIYSEIGIRSDREDQNVMKRLMEPIKIEERDRYKSRKHREKQQPNS